MLILAGIFLVGLLFIMAISYCIRSSIIGVIALTAWTALFILYLSSLI